MEILAETRVRPKNEITIPGNVREVLNLNPGDFVRFELDNNMIVVHKVITRKISNGRGG